MTRMRRMSGRNILRSVQFLASFSLFSFILFYYIFFFGFKRGMILSLLVWSFSILTIPAAHGSVIFGYPSSLFFHTWRYPEHFLWSGALIFSVVMFVIVPDIFLLSLPTHLLYYLLTHPNPYWLIFLVSLIGAGYRYTIGCDTLPKVMMRYMLMVAGIFLLFYFAHQEMIILLTVHMI